MADMGEVRLPLDLGRLGQYLKEKVPVLDKSDLLAKQFGTGTSNPTYLLWSSSDERQRFVLRRKPGGKLVPGAHQIDREYRVMAALHPHGVPVPKTFSLCEDPAVIGAPFYLMECVAGRVLTDNGASLSPGERTALWSSIGSAVAKLHGVDFRAAGLADYGKTGNFAERQVKTWARNFESVDGIVQKEVGDPQISADMRELQQYLLAGMAVLAPEPTCVVHGDIGLHNMMIHPTKPEVVAFLDWEISTLGHPLVDLDYASSTLPGGWREESIPVGAAAEGLPSAREFVEGYCQRRGLAPVPREVMEFCSLVNMFRFAAIVHGVFARGLSGNASSGSGRNKEMRAVYIGTLRRAVALMRERQGRSPAARL